MTVGQLSAQDGVGSSTTTAGGPLRWSDEFWHGTRCAGRARGLILDSDLEYHRRLVGTRPSRARIVER